MSSFSSVGNEIGTFLGGVLNPVLGGTTTTTTTTDPAKGSQATTIIVVVIVVAFIAVVGYFLFKQKQN